MTAMKILSGDRYGASRAPTEVQIIGYGRAGNRQKTHLTAEGRDLDFPGVAAKNSVGIAIHGKRSQEGN